MKYRPWGPRKQITISLKPDTYDRLRRLAEHRDKSKSLVIEELIEDEVSRARKLG